jgi:PKD repeat protein
VVDFIEMSETYGDQLCSTNWGFGDGQSSSLTNPTHTYLEAGTYIVSLEITTSTDTCINIECTDVFIDTIFIDSISEPCAMSLSHTKGNVSVNGASDGWIDLTVTGAQFPLSYNWSNGATTEDINGLSAGLYFVVVVDNALCEDSLTIEITEPLPCQLSLSYTQTNVSEYGGSDGSIDLTVSGAYGDLEYLWSNGATTEDIFNLMAGEYTVTVTDTSGCEDIATVNISQPDQINEYAINGNVFAKSALLPQGMALLIDEARTVIAKTPIVNGFYEFLDLSPANYYVYAVPYFGLDFEYYPQYFATYSGDVAFWTQADLIEVDSIESLNINLLYNNEIFYGDGLICGHVLYDSDASSFNEIYNQDWFGNSKSVGSINARNVTCFLIDEYQNIVDFCLTDASGEFRFENVPFGTYQLHIDFVDRLMNPLSINLSEDNDTICDLQLTMDEHHVIGIEEKLLNKANIQIWPNPFTDELTISIDQENLQQVLRGQLINAQGQIVKNFSFTSRRNTIELQNLEMGIYVIH